MSRSLGGVIGRWIYDVWIYDVFLSIVFGVVVGCVIAARICVSPRRG